MQETKMTCDKCKTVFVGNKYESGYKNVCIKFDDYTIKYFDLCPKCLEKLGLETKINNKTKEQYSSLGDKLYDLIAEIVSENIPE